MSEIKNILFIISDQMRSDALGCYGNDFVKTPALDGLAAEGVRFESCIVQASPCGPSRACLMSGTYLHRNRSTRNKVPLADAENNWGAWLREAGRKPVLVGNHDYTIDPAILPEGDERCRTFAYDNTLPGFDTELYHESFSREYGEFLRRRGYPETLLGKNEMRAWKSPAGGSGERWERSYPALCSREESETHFLTGRAMDYIASCGDEPWTLNLNIYKPHHPEICPEPYHDMYDPGTMPPPHRSEEELRDGHPYLRSMMKTGDEGVVRYHREQRALYHGMVSEVDDNLGRVFDLLKETGQWDETLIIFTSDHGAYNGDHWLNDKGHYFDSAIRVPLIIRDPSARGDAARGRSVTDLVSSVDIVPTLLDLMNRPVPRVVQGDSLAGYLDGSRSGPLREAVFSEFDYSDPFRPEEEDCKKLLWIVRDQRYKYVEFADPAYDPLFFDLESDPGEMNDLAGREEAVPLMWGYSRKLLHWRMQNEDRSMTELMRETLEACP